MSASKRLDELLNELKGRAESQLAALQAEKLALFMLVGNGGCLDCSPEQIATLKRTIQQLEEAIRLAKTIR